MENLKIDDFFGKVSKYAPDNRIPLRLIFELTYRCNFYCSYCYIPKNFRSFKELNTKEVFFIIEQLAKANTFYLGFSGGEIFLRKDILDILEFTKKKGFYVFLHTNGSLIDEKVAKELIRIGIDKVDINIVSLDKKIFKKITGRDSLDKVLKAVSLLKGKIPLGFKTCILKDNFKEIEKIKNFSKIAGGNLRLDDKLSPLLNSNRCNLDYSLYKQEIDKFNIDIDAFISKRKIKKLTAKDIFFCGAGFYQCAITAEGRLKLCVGINAPLYDARKNFIGAWNRLKYFLDKIRVDNYKCQVCKLKNFCDHCPAKSYIEHKDFVSCDKESRFFAYKSYKEFKKNERKVILKNSRHNSCIGE